MWNWIYNYSTVWHQLIFMSRVPFGFSSANYTKLLIIWLFFFSFRFVVIFLGSSWNWLSYFLVHFAHFLKLIGTLAIHAIFFWFIFGFKSETCNSNNAEVVNLLVTVLVIAQSTANCFNFRRLHCVHHMNFNVNTYIHRTKFRLDNTSALSFFQNKWQIWYCSFAIFAAHAQIFVFIFIINIFMATFTQNEYKRKPSDYP